jgi:hypothetical protein
MTRLRGDADRVLWAPPGAGLVVCLVLALVTAADERVAGADPAVGDADRGVAQATFSRDAGLPPAAPEPPAVQATPAPAPRPSDAPLRLTDPQPLAVKPSAAPRGPLPDWKLLLAVAAAFGILVAFRGVTAYTTRRATPLPPDVFDVLGEASLGGGHAVRVVRFGPKTLLISASTAGCQTLAELTDPQATDRIAAACKGAGHPRPTSRSRLAASRGDAGGRAQA